MNEREIKEICKICIEDGNYSRDQKEILKLMVDCSRNWAELYAVAVVANGLRR